LYNALDRLQAAGLAAIASPIMVASCLVGFVIYGAIALRERPNRHQWLGLLCSLGGIALLAMT
ncbi:MAG: EamA/RhaT family transporter, partial [Kiritimatiellae bacterium]|nr:EamA/RhaT family transporter [Kiritimatiellia bacterium]